MIAILDTCATLWLLEGPVDRLTAAARDTLSQGPVGVPAVVVLEFGYLIQHLRLHAGAMDHLLAELAAEQGPLVPVPFGLDAARCAADIPRAASSDPFDRMIAGRAMAAGLPLITADAKLAKVEDLTVIW